MDLVKLNIGGGDTIIDGFVNIDRCNGKEVYPLDCPDNSVDEMRASHILEHFGWNEIVRVVSNWVLKLKPGGSIKIGVPDFAKIVEMYNTKTDARLGHYLFGGQINENDYHKCAFDKDTLRDLMSKCGLIDIKEWTDDIQDSSALPVSLNLCGKKPIKEPRKELSKNKVAAVMSMPRLVFSDTMTCLMRALISKGINLTRESGVFWGQCLTRLIEKHCAMEEIEYIITIDYDSWFTYEDVTALLTLMETHPEYDAIFPLEVKREEEAVLVGIKPLPGDSSYVVSKQELMNNEVYPVDTGHFGLTVFRKSCFAKVKKPWFIPKPAPDGTWNDGRFDEDVMFWHNFKESGCKLGLATKVKIGHLQLMVTYPGKLENDWKPVNISLKDMEDKNKREALI